MSRTFHALRRVAGAVLLAAFVAVPFWRISGESALRFDVPSLRLFFFGARIGLEDFFVVLIGVIFLAFLALFLTAAFGRIWCGWMCPQTVLVDATSFVETARKRGAGAKAASYGLALLVSVITAAGAVGYFVSPYDLPALLSGGGTAAKVVTVSAVVLSAALFLNLIALRRRFCATVCPYAKLQSVLFDDRTLLVAFDARREGECMHCGACDDACPVEVDIRRGTHLACIHCAECADACAARMAAKNGKSLIGYAFGVPKDRKKGIRPGLVMNGVLAVIALLFLVYLSATGMSFEMTVLPAYPAQQPLLEKNGSITNGYTLSLRNRGDSDQGIYLRADSVYGPARIIPDHITLPSSLAVMKVPVSVTLIGKRAGKECGHASVTLTASLRQSGQSIMKKMYFPTQEDY